MEYRLTILSTATGIMAALSILLMVTYPLTSQMFWLGLLGQPVIIIFILSSAVQEANLRKQKGEG